MTSRPSLALLTQHYYPEMVSTGMHMTELMGGLAQLGWRITVYTAPPSWGSETGEAKPPKVMSYEGIEIVRGFTLGSQRGSYLARLLFALTYLASTAWGVIRYRRHYAGLIITTNPPFIGLVGWLFRCLTGKPYLLIVYDVYPDIAIRLGVLKSNSLVARTWEWLSRFILRNASSIVVIGQDMAGIISAKLPERHRSKLVLIPNWSDEQRVQPVPPQQNSFTASNDLTGRFVVQYAGRMGRTHNIEPILEAAKLLADEPATFQFVGDGAKKAILQQMAIAYKLTNVQFLPHQPMERLTEMLSASSLGVVCLAPAFTGLSVPSKAYGVMAAGKPFLAFMDPESEIGRTILENRCGIVLPEPDGETIADFILHLIRHPDELQKMGQRSRQTFLHNFTLSHAVDRYDVCLRSMMGI